MKNKFLGEKFRKKGANKRTYAKFLKRRGFKGKLELDITLFLLKRGIKSYSKD